MSYRIELFKFAIGSNTYTFTSNAIDIVYGADTYSSTIIKRGKLKLTPKFKSRELTVELSIANAMAVDLISQWQENSLTVTIFSQSAAGTATIFKGKNTDRICKGRVLQLIFEPISISLKRLGVRAKYLKICRHMLYSTDCGLSLESWAVNGSWTVISGTTLTIAAASGYADGYFLGGLLRSSAGHLGHIVNHAGSSIKILRMIDGMSDDPDKSIKIYPGCMRTKDVCDTKFSNVINHGGFPWLPYRNPFDGRSIV